MKRQFDIDPSQLGEGTPIKDARESADTGESHCFFISIMLLVLSMRTAILSRTLSRVRSAKRLWQNLIGSEQTGLCPLFDGNFYVEQKRILIVHRNLIFYGFIPSRIFKCKWIPFDVCFCKHRGFFIIPSQPNGFSIDLTNIY